MKLALALVVLAVVAWGSYIGGRVHAAGYPHAFQEWIAQTLVGPERRTQRDASVICIPEGVKTNYMCMFFPDQVVASGSPRRAFGWLLHLETHPEAEASLGPDCWEEYRRLQRGGKTGPEMFYCVNSKG